MSTQKEINADFGSRLKRLEYWMIGLTVANAGYWMDSRFNLVSNAVAYLLGVFG